MDALNNKTQKAVAQAERAPQLFGFCCLVFVMQNQIKSRRGS